MLEGTLGRPASPLSNDGRSILWSNDGSSNLSSIEFISCSRRRSFSCCSLASSCFRSLMTSCSCSRCSFCCCCRIRALFLVLDSLKYERRQSPTMANTKIAPQAPPTIGPKFNSSPSPTPLCSGDPVLQLGASSGQAFPLQQASSSHVVA